ncbi:MAG: hypothetical protein ACJASR_000047 [Psychroserpens sp.]|jgi:hypothetical protein
MTLLALVGLLTLNVYFVLRSLFTCTTLLVCTIPKGVSLLNSLTSEFESLILFLTMLTPKLSLVFVYKI